MKKRILLLIVLFLLAWGYQEADATNYYMRPYSKGGRDTNAGSLVSPIASLSGAIDLDLAAGDTLFIMGGIYDADHGLQRWTRGSGSGGTLGNPIVFKAYGDSIAVFTETGGPDRANRQYWYADYGGIDYIEINGMYGSDSLYIKLQGSEDASYLIRGEGESDNFIQGWKIIGIEVDGNIHAHPHAPMLNTVTGVMGFYNTTQGGALRYGLGWNYGTEDTIMSCYVHDIFHPVGTYNRSPIFNGVNNWDEVRGDSSDWSQGTGEAIYFNSVTKSYIAYNTFKNTTHAAITISTLTGSAPASNFNKIIYNNIDSHWGGGIYIMQNANYNLIEGNIVTRSGGSCAKTKSAFNLDGGKHNVIRKNVFYPKYQGQGLCLEALPYTGYVRSCDSNYVYNNTFYNALSANMVNILNNSGTNATASTKDNYFYNNIFYKSYGELVGGGVQAYPNEVMWIMLYSNNDNNWLDPDAGGTQPTSTHFGGNVFANNLFRRHKTAGDQDSIIAIQTDADYPGPYGEGEWIYSVGDLEVADPTAWANNIDDDPVFLDESPDTSEFFGTWYHLNNSSPCINAGVVVAETIGAYVEELYEGYGWSALSYNGIAPDIGAWESSAETPGANCLVYPTSLTFGTYIIGDSSAVDSFQISNTGDTWLDIVIELSNYTDFSVTQNGGMYALGPGDSKWVVIQFNPQSGGALSGTISTGEGSIFTDVSCTGMSASLTPSTINFGDVRVGECSTVQTLTLENTGTGTVSGTVSGDNPDFTITEGDGAFSLTAGQQHEISIQFCPLSYGAKSFKIHLDAYFDISDVSFSAGKNTITTNFTTNASASCRVYGGPYYPENPDDTEFSIWYSNATVHGTTHQHSTYYLTVETLYAVRIYARNAAGDLAWMPSEHGYYIVSTTDDDGGGGGLRGTHPELVEGE